MKEKLTKSADVGVAGGADEMKIERKKFLLVFVFFTGKYDEQESTLSLVSSIIASVESNIFFPSFLAYSLVGGGTALRRPVKASAWKHDNRNTSAGESPLFSLNSTGVCVFNL